VHPEFKRIAALYGGESGTHVKPDPMFKARVDCADCHTDATLALKGSTQVAALDVVCTNCHGRRFSGMLTRWNAGVRWRLDAVRAYVEEACADPRLDNVKAARGRLNAAKERLTIVDAGGALHNIRGTDALLRDAIDMAMEAYTAARVEAPRAPTLGPDAAGVACMRCHYGIETAKETAFNKPFDHGPHVLRGNVACTKCHTDESFLRDAKPGTDPMKREVDPRHGKTTLTRASCNECHHSPTTTAGCASCHRTDALTRAIRVTMPLKLTPKGAPASRVVAFEHRDHAKSDCATCHTSKTSVRTVSSCTSCHNDHHTQARQCASCHGESTRAAHKAQDHFLCASCHTKQTVTALMPDRVFCVSCHAKQADHKPDRECSTCHMQSSPADLRKRISGGR
jgi:hypothetical protein